MRCTYYIEWPSLDLGCGNGGRCVVGLLVVLQNLHMREGGTDKVSCGRKCKKINKEIIFEWKAKEIINYKWVILILMGFSLLGFVACKKLRHRFVSCNWVYFIFNWKWVLILSVYSVTICDILYYLSSLLWVGSLTGLIYLLFWCIPNKYLFIML